MLEIHAPVPHLARGTARRFDFLGTALWSILASRGESLFWIWNGVPIDVGYRVPFSSAYRDVLDVVETLLSAPEGRSSGHFIHHRLVADWEFAWSAGMLTLDSKWHDTPGHVEPLLAERPRIEMPVEEFLAEWKMPFRRLIDALDELGVVIDQDPGLLQRLRRAEAAIARFGSIYRAED